MSHKSEVSMKSERQGVGYDIRDKPVDDNNVCTFVCSTMRSMKGVDAKRYNSCCLGVQMGPIRGASFGSSISI